MKIKDGSLIYHTSFRLGLVINSNYSTADVYFFDEKKLVTMSVDYLEKNYDVEKIKENFVDLETIIKTGALEEAFSESTKSRAGSYYRNGLVKITGTNKNSIHASTRGTYTYTETISIDDKYVVSMKCSCPVGFRCKHLYALCKMLEGNNLHIQNIEEDTIELVEDNSFVPYIGNRITHSNLEKMDKLLEKMKTADVKEIYDYFNNKDIASISFDSLEYKIFYANEALFSKIKSGIAYSDNSFFFSYIDQMRKAFVRATQNTRRNYYYDREKQILNFALNNKWEEFTGEIGSGVYLQDSEKIIISHYIDDFMDVPENIKCLSSIFTSLPLILKTFSNIKNEEHKNIFYLLFEKYLKDEAKQVKITAHVRFNYLKSLISSRWSDKDKIKQVLSLADDIIAEGEYEEYIAYLLNHCDRSYYDFFDNKQIKKVLDKIVDNIALIKMMGIS